jgi:TDG/mug DNA glycosylase family protein
MARASRTPWKPSREQVAAAAGATVPDLIAPGLRVLFCGINPGLYSGAVGHHFARPGNRFWKVLHLAGFTDSELSPFEDRRLLDYGLGITNLVKRATASAAELEGSELRRGATGLRRRLRRYFPSVVAFAGMSAYRTAFDRPHASIGRQQERIDGCDVWLLPNPSGAQATYQLGELVAIFAALRAAAAAVTTPSTLR